MELDPQYLHFCSFKILTKKAWSIKHYKIPPFRTGFYIKETEKHYVVVKKGKRLYISKEHYIPWEIESNLCINEALTHADKTIREAAKAYYEFTKS